MSSLALPSPEGLRNLGRLQDIPAVRQLALLGIVAVAIALGLWLFFWTQKPDYVPVFAGLDPKSMNEATELLASAQIPYRLEPGTGALAVPAEQLGEAKLALASAGLPASHDKGFETIQGDQGFGTSQFVENARYQHALETELARTIANLRPVREARVHLALPKPSAFTRQKEPASASVVLQLKSGATLEQNQVNAIVHLVASSIPGLPVANVTVVDQFGRMLSNADPTSEDAIGQKQFDQQRRQEAVFVQRIQELLEPMTGPGRVSAQVTVDMDFSQTEQARETYGPPDSTAGTMVRSEQISEMNSGGAAAPVAPVAQGVPGAVANTPGAAPEAAAAAATTGPNSRTAVRNFEVDRTLTHTRQAPGRIRRVTAAVLVDNVAGAAAKGKSAAPATRALTEAELKRIETLVQQAIGFDAQRGDAVSVVNAPFARAEQPAGEPLPIWQDPQARGLLRTLLGGLAVLAVIFFVIRPTFRQLVQPKAPAKAPPAAEVAVLDEDVPVSLTSSASAAKAPALPGTQQAVTFEEKVQVAREAVTQDPKRVANVIRDWVGNDG